jgi:hypothetical protein
MYNRKDAKSSRYYLEKHMTSDKTKIIQRVPKGSGYYGKDAGGAPGRTERAWDTLGEMKRAWDTIGWTGIGSNGKDAWGFRINRKVSKYARNNSRSTTYRLASRYSNPMPESIISPSQ